MTLFGGKSTRRNNGQIQSSEISSIVAQLFESNFKTKIQIGRVLDIILNPNHPEFSSKGYWNSIGTIKYTAFPKENSTGKGTFARPYFSNISSFPLVNEYVLLFQLPDIFSQDAKGSNVYYYLPAVNLFNNPHINPLPTKAYNVSLSGANYGEEISTGSGPNYEFNSPNNPSQNTFVELDEKSTPLLPFAGDIIYQGRFGNSIRLGSTAKPQVGKIPPLNNWSGVGDPGSPITIISNGQNEKGFEWVTENINNNDSSIYLTSTQNIPLNAAIKNYASYTPALGEVPYSPATYSGRQVIINSGRLVFNTTTDHILLSSQRTISFGAVKGFNFDTPANFVVNIGTHIKLGNRFAEEPLIKGNELYDTLFNLITALKQTIDIMSLDTKWPGGSPVADIPKGETANSTSEVLKKLLEGLDDIKSKKVFTI